MRKKLMILEICWLFIDFIIFRNPFPIKLWEREESLFDIHILIEQQRQLISEEEAEWDEKWNFSAASLSNTRLNSFCIIK